ncbi:MAG: hypothetical protein R6W73_01845 [Candidatus Saliniplasma sp.]
MDDEKIRWKETRYKSIIRKYMILLPSIIITIFTIFVIIGKIIFEPPIQLTVIVGIFFTIIVAISPLFSLKTAKKRIGYDSRNVYYIDRDGSKEKLRFSDIGDISVPSQEDSAVIVKTKKEGDDGKVILGPVTGGKYGRSLIESYKRWIEENTEKKVSVEFVSYDIPFPDWGEYVIKLKK